MHDSRFIIGIDLGTTNIALFYIDTEQSDAMMNQFKIPQLVAAGEVDELSLLPSFCYLPRTEELLAGNLGLPWEEQPESAVGKFARDYGATVPSQFIASAKSWLVHAGVDRTKPILPWGCPPQQKSKSPLEVTMCYLSHLKNAWNTAFKRIKDRSGSSCLLEEQQVTITIPASFDEVARDLTIKAAELAGLKNIALVEEPLAALYAWLQKNEDTWQDSVKPGEKILVIDVGGGTTDFSLIEMDINQVLHRYAVGEHLLLGGDNIDMAIARRIEESWGVKLTANEWSKLCQQCRNAKESLLSTDRNEVDVTLMTGGSSVLANLKKAVLTRGELIEILESGFYPQPEVDSVITKTQSGIREMGLPYAANPAITEHLLEFLRYAESVAKCIREVAADNNNAEDKKIIGKPKPSLQEKSSDRVPTSGIAPRNSSGNGGHVKMKNLVTHPEKVLFNGGSMASEGVRKRIMSVISSWHPELPPPEELHGEDLSLAVAIGATYYGRVRRGWGVKVRGGISRSYYLEVVAGTGSRKLVCVMSRDTDENVKVDVPGVYRLQTNQKVLFNLYSSATRLFDEPGSVVDDTEELTLVAPLITVLQFGKTESKSVEVRISSEETEVGALRIFLISTATGHQWPLQFDLRPIPEQGPNNDREGLLVVDSTKLNAARGLLKDYFSTNQEKLPGLMSDIENLLGIPRRKWSIPLLRELVDTLQDLEVYRKQSAKHEMRWLNFLGFFLRPGFGDPEDSLRLRSVWKLWFNGPIYSKEVQVVSEWWVLWRRIAPGLKAGHQLTIASVLRKHLFPKSTYQEKIRYGDQVKQEMWRCLGALELLSVEMKTLIGNILLKRGKKLLSSELWVIARLGSRKMFHAPGNFVLPANTVGPWINQLMTLRPLNSANNYHLFALTRLATITGDRSKDLSSSMIERVHQFLESNNCLQTWLEHLKRPTSDSPDETAKVLGDALPLGLTLIDDC